MSNPIVDISIQDLTKKGPNTVSGWTFLSQDLNQSVGGHYIYLGLKRGTSKALTSLTFEAYSYAQQGNPKAGWKWNSTDLNRGAGGAYIYTFWKKGEAGKSPIKGIMILATNQSSPYSISGWTHTGVDLNKGAGGLYIWAYYSTTIESP